MVFQEETPLVVKKSKLNADKLTPAEKFFHEFILGNATNVGAPVMFYAIETIAFVIKSFYDQGIKPSQLSYAIHSRHKGK